MNGAEFGLEGVNDLVGDEVAALGARPEKGGQGGARCAGFGRRCGQRRRRGQRGAAKCRPVGRRAGLPEGDGLLGPAIG